MPHARRPPHVRRVVLLTILLALPAALAGCLGERSSPVEVTPYYVLNDAQPGRATEFAFHLRSTSPFKQTLGVTAQAPQGWLVEPESPEVTLQGEASSSLVVRVTPDANATYGPQDLVVRVGDTAARVMVNVRDLGTEPLREGVGTQLYYVLWYANGTLASTNDRALLHRGLGQPVLDDPNETEYEPLKVYVGGRRGEDPPEPYNSTGYRPVIAGFDERLRDAGDGRGMVAGDTLAVRVPAAEAYTRPGNEEHPLYGEDLSFLIRIVSVDVFETRACDLPVCPPP